MARQLRPDLAQHRTVPFSGDTHDSFVALPLALAWPEGGELTAAVIVLQWVVELR